ncbi:hypothetical protein ACIRSS_41810 [Amycolatopsis sp. NPDC101161]|uniref:hypothetical protein n=1 Tax=Amycolatopsis sp. NPDC101161 TaxID=3363940 RepID=UPI0037FAD9B6
MPDLTAFTDTYYVEAGNTPVLVHNCPPAISGGQAAQQGGAAYEDYLHDALGGGGNFSEGGREFDGAFVNPANGAGTWYEAKSGGYRDRLLNNPRALKGFNRLG